MKNLHYLIGLFTLLSSSLAGQVILGSDPSQEIEVKTWHQIKIYFPFDNEDGHDH